MCAYAAPMWKSKRKKVEKRKEQEKKESVLLTVLLRIAAYANITFVDKHEPW